MHADKSFPPNEELYQVPLLTPLGIANILSTVKTTSPLEKTVPLILFMYSEVRHGIQGEF